MDAWSTSTLARAAGIAAMIVALLVAVRQLSAGSATHLPQTVAAAAAAGLALAAGAWRGDARHQRATPYALAAAASVAATAWAAGRTWAIVVAVSCAALAAVIVWAIADARRRARPTARLAAAMATATRDRRALRATMRRPTRSSAATGLPALWRSTLDVDPGPGARATLTAAASRATGGQPVALSWATPSRLRPGTRGHVRITRDTTPPRPADLARLDAILARALGPGARVTDLDKDADGTINAVHFAWPPALADRVTSNAYRARVPRALSSALGGPVECEWRPTKDTATATRAKPIPDLVPHPPRAALSVTGAAFGVGAGGRLCIWDLDDAEPHVLIVGRTRGGKTALLRTLIAQLGMIGRQMGSRGEVAIDLHLLDPKIAGLRGTDHAPGVRVRATSPAAMAQVVQGLEAEMMRRYEAIDRDPRARARLRRQVLVLDEGRTFYERLNTYWRDVEKPQLVADADAAKKAGDPGPRPTGTEHPAVESLRSILRLGGEAHINVIFATQQADAAWLTTDARANFGVRIALGSLDPDASRMVFNDTAGCAPLPPVKGRGWVKVGGGMSRTEQVQMFWTPSFTTPDHRPGDAEILRALDPELLVHPDPDPDELVVDEPDEPHVVDQPVVDQADGPDEPVVDGSGVDEPVAATADVDELMVDQVDEGSQSVTTCHDLDTVGSVGRFPGAESRTVPDHEMDSGDQVEGIVDGEGGVPVSVLDLMDDERVAVPHPVTGQTVAAIVEEVAPDLDDPDRLCVSFRTSDGARGVLSVADGEVVTALDR